ncbi:hypothetical protein JOB18_024173 [Solea senegalensis]|uniref:Secreted protein n=1 Tax=Solea senegalensis TaxID=28829 RepID=A0AAV6T7A1_SOLSE|nr:hypothetical protein JOB18_024173 [Solea senegalensis]
MRSRSGLALRALVGCALPSSSASHWSEAVVIFRPLYKPRVLAQRKEEVDVERELEQVFTSLAVGGDCGAATTDSTQSLTRRVFCHISAQTRE